MRLAIEGGRVLLPDGTVAEVTVTLAEGQIIGIGHAIAASHFWHARGYLVLPGIVDLHGNAFESHLMPRAGAFMAPDIAFPAVDRQLLANGITTAFHGLTLSWTPGLRGGEMARNLADALAALSPTLDCNTRVHLRFETLALDAVEEVITWIEAGRIDLLSFNDDCRGPDQPVAAGEEGTALDRSGLDRAAYRALRDRVQARRAEVPQALARLARAAREAGVPLASHNDASPEIRRQFRALGCRICESPVDVATAEAAVQARDTVVMSAPGVVSGTSHAERLSARQAVGDRLCSILASDFYYPALVAAPFVLAAERVIDFPGAWRLVSANPAAAAGLDDRGTIGLGQRADLVLIDDAVPGRPRVVAAIAGGQIAYVADAALAGRLEHYSGMRA